MPASLPITFDSAALLAAGLALAAAAVLVALLRRAPAPGAAAATSACAGLLALALAAGGPRVGDDEARRVAVLLDGSASTDGAAFRDPARREALLAQLLGDRPRVTVLLGASDDGTTWTAPPPDASAVLLLSDGRFEPPATSPPVFAVIDPALDRPGDAAVTALQRRDDQLIVTTRNDGPARALDVTGTAPATPATRPVVPAGARTLSFDTAPGDSVHTARFEPGDRWPQNDALTLANHPPAGGERWWVGGDAPDATWRAFTPSELPAQPAAYLAPSVIVLHNVPAAALAAPRAQRVEQYVRDLGGGLLILGGDRAFAAGEYDGTPLDSLSPLASSPPAPAAHWTFLIDASGSMAGETGGRTRLAAAVAAARAAVERLPPADLVSAAGFADDLRWWVRGKPADAFTLGAVPPARGATNLDAALRALVPSLDRGMPNHVVLLTDGQVELTAAQRIATTLQEANARLHVFATGTGAGLPALRALAEATGGTAAQESDAARWAAGMEQLLRPLRPRHWNATPAEVRFNHLPTTTAAAWNRTWLRREAEELARIADAGAGAAAAAAATASVPMAARMNVGIGHVTAAAFRPPVAHVEALAALVQTPPRDPRLRVTWRAGRHLVVEVDATDDATPINNLSPTLVLSNPAGADETIAVPQVGPGRYTLELPAPRSPVLAIVRESGRVLDRFAVAGRYGREFDGIGNDRAALRSLAQRTGGRVIEPRERGRLALPAPDRRATPLAPLLATAGAALLGLGLVAWRRGR